MYQWFKFQSTLLREEISYQFEAFLMLDFIDHSKQGLGLTQMIIKIWVFSEAIVEIEDIVKRLWISEMQLRNILNN